MPHEILTSKILHLLKATFQVGQDLTFTDTSFLSAELPGELPGELLFLRLAFFRCLIFAQTAIFHVLMSQARLHSKQAGEEHALKAETREGPQDELAKHEERVYQSTDITE